MNNERDSFLQAWEHFENVVKIKLIEKAKDADLTASYANIILREVVSMWFKNYGEEGIWLTRYSEINSSKGAKISRVLKEDSVFTECPQKRNISSTLKYVIPMAGAVAGLGLSKIVTSNIIINCASAVIPAVALYPYAKKYEKGIIEDYKKEIVNSYVAQLDDFKEKIFKIIDE